jgi:hypothetical protein
MGFHGNVMEVIVRRLLRFCHRIYSGFTSRWGHQAFVFLVAGLVFAPSSLTASLIAYDAAIAEDAAGGLMPLARLTSALALTGSNRGAFNFGTNSGAATMEFILEGDPSVNPSAYLAVGANANSNLRYELWNDTGQLGFTELGVADYSFSPGAPSPTQPAHVAYVWNAATLTMKLYLNGVLAGTRSGVSANFAMPRGQGWLGANPSGSEPMVGTVYRVTVYDGRVSEDVILAHSDAFNGIVRPPAVLSFAATPETIFSPASTTLAWNVRDAIGVFVNGVDVSGNTNLTVTPVATTTYQLVATNASGSAASEVTVRVNPPPAINRFVASPGYANAGAIITLSWNASFGDLFTISPDVGDVTAHTVGGIGSVEVHPTMSTSYLLMARSAFGTNTATASVHVVEPAKHLVISEFMADDQSTLADEDGQFSGWIEIHNPTTAPVDLAGHFLTDQAGNPMLWAFPSTNLAPGGYLVVFASGKNRAQPGAPLHTSFRLNNNGEYLALVGPGPILLHSFSPVFPPQRPDISYGLLASDPALERYLAVPTPGAPNDETAPPPAPVKFSIPKGFFTSAFTLTLSTLEPGADIWFTTNGSVPAVTNGSRYTSALQVTGTTRLRAVAVLDGMVGQLSGASYIKLAPDLAAYTSSLPILVVENFGAGTIPAKGWNSTGAGLKQVPRQAAIWATFDQAGGFSALTNPPQMFSPVGIRGRGAYSTEWRQKPYNVEAVDEEGAEAKVSPLGMPAHADWVLYFPDPDQDRDPTLLFNTFAYELSRNMDDYAVRFRWVEAFINEDGGDLRLADRRGVYAIIEKVARGKERLDFQQLSADGSSGSWLLGINRMDPEPETGWPAPNGASQPWFFHTAGPDRVLQTEPNTAYSVVPGDDIPQQWNAFINFDNPNGYLINTNQRAAIEGWMSRFEKVLYNDALWRDPTNGYRRYLDTRDFADYFVLNVLTRNGDGLLLSMYPWKGDDDKLRMGPAWDYNWSAYYISGGPTGSLMYRSEQLWYPRLFADPDFLQSYIDRWWELRQGPLSNAALAAIVDHQAAEITPEKALLNGLPSATEWSNRLSQMKTWLTQRADWIDSNYLRPPALNKPGGEVPDGFLVSLAGSNGATYLTTDNTDPRAPGGAVAGTARAYTGPFPLHSPTVVKARVKNGANWSGLTTGSFNTPQDLTKLLVTEIMYRPPPYGAWAAEDLEFLELKNTGTNFLNLGGMTFNAGIEFTFTNNTQLGPGQFFLLARNPTALQAKYPGVMVNGVYTGKLSDTGETIRLALSSGSTVFSLTFNNRAPWPLAADGYGFSIVPATRPSPTPGSPDWDDGSNWRASAVPGGSPGADDPAVSVAPVLINEVLTRSTPPRMDSIELLNPNTERVDVSGWFLSDDGAVPKKFRIPDNTILNPAEFRVFTEADFNPVPATLLSFALDSAGDSVYLTAADAGGNLTGYSHGVKLGASAADVSFGRYLDSAGGEHFPAQIALSLGQANRGPLVGPVIITEIMYHPDSNGVEFIELRNITGSAVPLFDEGGPGGPWRVDGLAFTFPNNLILPPRGWALVVATDPATFRAKYNVPAPVLVCGPFAGTLQDDGELLALQRSDSTIANQMLYITVDEVFYRNGPPWPPGGNGDGFSLQRKSFVAYGNDPANWLAAPITPGVDYIDLTDPNLDSDGDGMSNRDEALAGTDPADPASVLKIQSATLTESGISLSFVAISNKTYTVEYTSALETGVWSKLTDVLGQTSNHVETVMDSAPVSKRFYRLLTPRLP